ncbi:hypothetical protein [Motiliproteus coralliicola]|uniref:hypothetical protein n=1 Tax=Motiliproteus coralliicola TaxID=2283196 RepID=UPI001402A52F|nr:hypothetical protein [Motiliproteus coralliicola]
MKIIGAIISICLAFYLFFQANAMTEISLERLGYIAGGVILVVATIFVFIPMNKDRSD